jgi:hypothetical protein
LPGDHCVEKRISILALAKIKPKNKKVQIVLGQIIVKKIIKK